MANKFDDYIETISGKKFYFLNPDPDDIDINDIAHSLGMQCRYTGHAKMFYSIAEHSVLVSELCEPENAFWGLMHDASEAYLTDVASPIKQYLTNYKEMEGVLMDAIADKYGLPREMPEDVHMADRIALLAEAQLLIPSGAKDWMVNIPDLVLPEVNFKLHTPSNAKYAFLDAFENLREK
jgi:hypothetical protein